MKYKNEDLKRLQDIELGILREVIRICEENSIQYFSVGGTTLGAIRHKGFIPWDDDIDIGMLRSDYDKFIRIAPEMLQNGYTLTHFVYEPTSPTYYAKVRKDGTEFIEKPTQNIKMHHGVFIDIMPYDEVPEDKTERKRFCRRAKLWNQLYIAKTVWTSTSPTSKHKWVRNCVRAILHIFMVPVPKKYLFEKTDKAMQAYNGMGSRVVSSRGLDVFNCLIEDLLPPEKHEFSGVSICIPGNWDKVLKTQYGDYMTLPPKEKRYSHAPVRLKF